MRALVHTLQLDGGQREYNMENKYVNAKVESNELKTMFGVNEVFIISFTSTTLTLSTHLKHCLFCRTREYIYRASHRDLLRTAISPVSILRRSNAVIFLLN